MNRFIDISLMRVSGIIEASNDEDQVSKDQHAVNKLRKERVFTQSGPFPEAELTCNRKISLQTSATVHRRTGSIAGYQL
jgi:hypothetical protein